MPTCSAMFRASSVSFRDIGPCSQSFGGRRARFQKLASPQSAAQDGKVASAAAQISDQRRPYVAFARLRALQQERGERDCEARRAIAALKSDFGDESRAHRATRHAPQRPIRHAVLTAVRAKCSRNKSTNRASAGARMVCVSPLRRKRTVMLAVTAAAPSTSPPTGVRARSA